MPNERKMTPSETRDLEDNRPVILYAGDVTREGYRRLTEVLEGLPSPQSGATLILMTHGGDPHAGYRIARALQHHFHDDGYRVIVPAECKSAGTLICIGASELVICDRGELGPLDIQLIKANELFERTSGLDLPQSISAAKTDAIQAFKDTLVAAKISSNLSTKISGELACQLVTGLFAPLFAQIDPTKLGEHQRANLIGNEYAERLSQKWENIGQAEILQLVTGYPSHEFVIDRKEARALFQRVDKPTPQEFNRIKMLYKVMDSMLHARHPMVMDFSDHFYSGFEGTGEESRHEPEDASQNENDSQLQAAPEIPRNSCQASGEAE